MLAVTLGPLAVAAVLFIVYIILTAAEARETMESLAERTATYTVPDDLLQRRGSARDGHLSRRGFDSDQVEKLKRVFAVADGNESGSIEKGDLLKMAEAINPEATAEDIGALVDKVVSDADGGGDISFGAFMRIVHWAWHEHEGSHLSDFLEKMDSSAKKSTSTVVVYLFLLLTFLVLISSSTCLFHFFKCDDFEIPEEDGGGTVAFLAKDLSLNCDSERYKRIVGYAIVMILVHPIGKSKLLPCQRLFFRNEISLPPLCRHPSSLYVHGAETP